MPPPNNQGLLLQGQTGHSSGGCGWSWTPLAELCGVTCISLLCGPGWTRMAEVAKKGQRGKDSCAHEGSGPGHWRPQPHPMGEVPMAHAHPSVMLGVTLALGRGLGSRDSLRDGENSRHKIQGAVIGSLGNTHISQHQAATDPSLSPGPSKLCRAAGNHRPLPTHFLLIC